MSVVMPAMAGPQQTAWHALMDVQVLHPTGWTLVGGQMVHLHCAERGASPSRPTDDVDAVLDVRAEPHVLHGFTTALTELGFEPAGETWTGHQHRWERGDATVDILIPRHLGEVAANRKGAGGGTAIETPGAQQALDRTEDVEVTVAGRAGTVRRPNLLGALVGKAAAHTVSLDRGRDRHVTDFAVLATLIRRSDAVGTATKRDRQYLTRMLDVLASDPRPWGEIEGTAEGVDRLRLALSSSSTSSSPSSASSSTPPSWGHSREQGAAPSGGQLRSRSRAEPQMEPEER